MQHFRCDLISAELITSLSLLAMLLVQSRVPSVTYVARMCCLWSTWHPSGPSGPSLQNSCPAGWPPAHIDAGSCFPKGRTLHFSSLNFIKFLLDAFSSQGPSGWQHDPMASQWSIRFLCHLQTNWACTVSHHPDPCLLPCSHRGKMGGRRTAVVAEPMCSSSGAGTGIYSEGTWACGSHSEVSHPSTWSVLKPSAFRDHRLGLWGVFFFFLLRRIQYAVIRPAYPKLISFETRRQHIAYTGVCELTCGSIVLRLLLWLFSVCMSWLPGCSIRGKLVPTSQS